MTPQQAIDYYGSRGALAKTCDVTDAAIYLWVKQGFIPYDKQCQIQVDTQRAAGGKKPLSASWYDVPEERRPENIRAA
jgi:hypothetical protein